MTDMGNLLTTLVFGTLLGIDLFFIVWGTYRLITGLIAIIRYLSPDTATRYADDLADFNRKKEQQ